MSEVLGECFCQCEAGEFFYVFSLTFLVLQGQHNSSLSLEAVEGHVKFS